MPQHSHEISAITAAHPLTLANQTPKTSSISFVLSSGCIMHTWELDRLWSQISTFFASLFPDLFYGQVHGVGVGIGIPGRGAGW